MTDTHIDAANRLLTVAREGRLTRGAWHRTADGGRELACMLYAMSNGVKIDSPEKCPSAWMPKWLAELIPPMFDGHSDADSLAFATRFGTLMTDPKWARISWDDVRREFLIAAATQALESARPVAGKETYWAQVESAHRQVVEALRGNGDLVAAEAASKAAARAADEAAAEAAEAAAEAAEAAAEAAEAVAWAAAWASAWAAEAAARAAAEAAAEAAGAARAAAAEAAAWAAARAARKALGATLCDLIEAEMAKVTP